MRPTSVSRRSPALLVFAVLSSSILTHAQEDPPIQQFRWTFDNAALGSSLPTCQPLKINITPFDATVPSPGLPPYYMLAFAVGGTPRLYPLGTALDWVVDYPAGTRMMLNVVDSRQTTGGIPSQLYTTAASDDISCVQPEEEQPDFTISTNVTENLETCAPWGATVDGGVPPYIFSIAALDSFTVTNVSTTSNQDNTLTYINRALPGGHLLVTASDVTGRFASGSVFVETAGGSDPTCPGLVTSTGFTEIPDQTDESQDEDAAEEPASSGSGSKNTTAVAIGVSIGVAALLLILLGLFLLRRRRRSQAAGTYMDTKPRSYSYHSRDNSHEMAYRSNQYGQGAAADTSSAYPSTGQSSTVMDISPIRRENPSPFADRRLEGSSLAGATFAKSRTLLPLRTVVPAQRSQPSSTVTHSSESYDNVTSPSTFRDLHNPTALSHSNTTTSSSRSRSMRKGQPPPSAVSGGISASDLQRALSVPSTRSGSDTATVHSNATTTRNPFDYNLSRTESGELYVQHRDGGVIDVVTELPPPYVPPPTPARGEEGTR